MDTEFVQQRLQDMGFTPSFQGVRTVVEHLIESSELSAANKIRIWQEAATQINRISPGFESNSYHWAGKYSGTAFIGSQALESVRTLLIIMDDGEVLLTQNLPHLVQLAGKYRKGDRLGPLQIPTDPPYKSRIDKSELDALLDGRVEHARRQQQ